MDESGRFQLLGPMRAWRGEHEIDVGAPRQRAVLAALLARPGRPVPRDEIIAFVWGNHPPPTASAAVHTYVRGLRRALDPSRTAWSRGGVVRSSSRGYELLVEPGRVDHVAFRALVGRGRRQYAQGASDAAVDTLIAALGLWRGRPMADFPGGGEWRRLASVLQGERFAAGVLAADAAAAADRVTEVLPWLAELARSGPLHEPLHARLIEAYRRAGQRSDALAAFHRIRHALAARRGAGPGGELRAAVLRVLDDGRLVTRPDGR